nr:hypothetical protein GCM10023233_21920 [Brevibacterium otitidis]
MNRIRVYVKTHWMNGWFIRMFASPVVCVNDRQFPASFTEPTVVSVDVHALRIGAGIRYFSRGPVLGCEPELFRVDESFNEVNVVLKNGFWNHSPFRIVSAG